MEDDELQQKTLLRPREAAAHFDVPLRTIYVWYQMGKIEGINMNGAGRSGYSARLSGTCWSPGNGRKGKPERIFLP